MINMREVCLSRWYKDRRITTTGLLEAYFSRQKGPELALQIPAQTIMISMQVSSVRVHFSAHFSSYYNHTLSACPEIISMMHRVILVVLAALEVSAVFLFCFLSALSRSSVDINKHPRFFSRVKL